MNNNKNLLYYYSHSSRFLNLSIQKSLRRSKKRKQDFLFFSLPCLLVSDEVTPNQNWLNNGGVTLPDDKNATHNGALSPLFLERNGRSGPKADHSVIERGNYGYFWTKNTNIDAYFLLLNHGSVLPSDINIRTYTISLRCLVSTNNR